MFLSAIIAIRKYLFPWQKERSRMLGFLLLLTGLLLVIFFSQIVGLITGFVRENLSRDHELSAVTISDIKHYYSYFLILFMGFAFIVYQNLHVRIRDYAISVIDFDRLGSIVLSDPAAVNRKLPVFLLLSGTVTGILLIIFYAFYGQPRKEGILEDTEAVLLLAASVIMAIAATRVSRTQFISSHRKIRIILIITALAFFVLFGEEISWGQRFIGFHSPEFFDEYNYQSEFNLHNFFNPLYDIIYKTAGITFFMVLFLVWFFKRSKPSRISSLLIPPPSFSFLIFLMACTTFGNREIFEILMDILILLYSIRMVLCLRNDSLKQSPAHV